MRIDIPNSNVLITDKGILFPEEISEHIQIFGFDSNGELSKQRLFKKKVEDSEGCFTLISFSGEIDFTPKNLLWGDKGLITFKEIYDKSKKNSRYLETYKLEVFKDYQENIKEIFCQSQQYLVCQSYEYEINEDISYLFGILSNYIDITHSAVFIRTLRGNARILVPIMEKIIRSQMSYQDITVQYIDVRKWDIIRIKGKSFSKFFYSIVKQYGRFPIGFRTMDKKIFAAYGNGIFNTITSLTSDISTMYLTPSKQRKLLYIFFMINEVEFRTTPQPRRYPLKIELKIGDAAKSIKRSNKEIASISPIQKARVISFLYDKKTWCPIVNSFLAQGWSDNYDSR